MKSRTLMPVVGATVLVAGAALVWLASSQDATQSVAEISQSSPQHATPPPLVSQAPAASATPAGPVDLPGITQGEQGHDFDDALKAQLRAISEAYREQVQYPEFSQPIEAEALAAKYLPNAPVALGMPADLRDPASPELSLQAEKVRFFSDDAPAVLATITGLPPQEESRVSGQLRMGEQILAYAQVAADTEQAHRYRLDFGQVVPQDISWKEEAFMVVDFEFRGQRYTRSLPVSFVASLARVDGVGSAQVDEAYLKIPVNVSTDKPGYHRLKGNLYDARSNTPLVHLKAEQNIEASSGVITLKAHIAALQASGSEGPYELRDLSLQRMPSAPHYITEYGDAGDMHFTVDGFPFSAYQHTPYIHEKAQRIAKELTQLGS